MAPSTRSKAGPGLCVGIRTEANGSLTSSWSDGARFDAEEAEKERVETALNADDYKGDGEQEWANLIELREPLRCPTHDDPCAEGDAGQQKDARQSESTFEGEPAIEAADETVLWIEAVNDRDRARGNAQPRCLRAQHTQHAGDRRHVHVPLATEHSDRGERERDEQEEAGQEEEQAGNHEQPRRAVHEQEAQMPPAIAIAT